MRLPDRLVQRVAPCGAVGWALPALLAWALLGGGGGCYTGETDPPGAQVVVGRGGCEGTQTLSGDGYMIRDLVAGDCVTMPRWRSWGARLTCDATGYSTPPGARAWRLGDPLCRRVVATLP